MPSESRLDAGHDLVICHLRQVRQGLRLVPVLRPRSARCIRFGWRARVGIPFQHRHNALCGIVPGDLADGHQGAERVQQILLECRPGDVGLQPFNRSRVPGLGVHVPEFVGSSHSTDGNLRGELSRKYNEVAFLHPDSECPQLSGEVASTSRLVVRPRLADVLCDRVVVRESLQRRDAAEVDDGEVVLEREVLVLAVAARAGEVHIWYVVHRSVPAMLRISSRSPSVSLSSARMSARISARVRIGAGL